MIAGRVTGCYKRGGWGDKDLEGIIVTGVFNNENHALAVVEEMIEQDFPMDQVPVLHRAGGQGDDVLGIAYADEKECFKMWGIQGALNNRGSGFSREYGPLASRLKPLPQLVQATGSSGLGLTANGPHDKADDQRQDAQFDECYPDHFPVSSACFSFAGASRRGTVSHSLKMRLSQRAQMSLSKKSVKIS